MVTVRQFSRGINRVARAAERSANRAHRQRVLQEKASAKQAMLEASAEAVEIFEQNIRTLTGSHRIKFHRRNWDDVANMVIPGEPIYANTYQKVAEDTLARYAPSWLSRVTGMASRKRNKLREAIELSRKEDENMYRIARDNAERKIKEIKIAKEVVDHNPEAIINAISTYGNFDEIGVEAINLFAVGDRVIAVVDALELEDMPTQSVALLQSGKASFKNITSSKIAELHRDNICSSAIRVAAEMLKAVPVNAVEVIMQTDMLDSSTGFVEARTILYIRVTAQALEKVNLLGADAYPLAERLGACFSWSKKEGFRPLVLKAEEFPKELVESLL